MADKSQFNGAEGKAAQKSTWTDGLPHNFQGWGPKTPDPDEPADDQISAPDGTLTWGGEGDAHTHHIWRFDMRRHHHH